MKSLAALLSVLLCTTACAADAKAPAKPAAKAAAAAKPAAEAAPAAKKAAGGKYVTYSVDGFFSCLVPDGWDKQRDEVKDKEYNIFEVELLAPGAVKAPTSVFVSYYSADNEDFSDHNDFIDRNSKNVLGETKSARETYQPVKKSTLAGRQAFVLEREKLAFLHPETKSDESVALQEKLYILPAKAGFYVLHYSAEKAAFAKHLAAFEKVAASFKGKP